MHLTPDRLAELGEVGSPCRDCLVWELDPVRRSRVDAGDAGAEKQAWLSEVLREWGSCGRVAVVEDRPVGYVGYAPAAYVPGAEAHPTAPISPDAVLLTTAWVDPAFADSGLGRVLVQAMAADLKQRGGIRAVEAFASTARTRPGRVARGCRLPQAFLAQVGFRTHRAHPVTPRMRMDLSSALTWRDEVEVALERLLGVVRPRRASTPARSRPAARDSTDATAPGG